MTAISTSAGAISERYAYTAYGQPTILNASGTPLSPQTSTLNTRYSYTGREWDATLGLHHFRARWMSPSAGRFLGRDPIGYVDGYNVYMQYFGLTDTDPSGLRKVCCKFRYGYVVSQFTTKEVECAQGKTANDCCRDYGAFPRLWAVEDSVDRPCKKSPNPVLLCDLKPVTTVKWVTTTTVICGKPVVSIHPIVVVGTVLVCANEWFIDHDPDINLPTQVRCYATGSTGCKNGKKTCNFGCDDGYSGSYPLDCGPGNWDPPCEWEWYEDAAKSTRKPIKD